MTQSEARRRARELGGIAVEARCRNGRWVTGGWPNHRDATWIVVDITISEVLDSTL